MATDVERLVVSLEASAKKLEKEMNRATAIVNRQAQIMDQRTRKLSQQIEGNFGRLGSRISASLKGVLAGLSVQQIVEFSDAFTKAQNSLRVTGLEGDKLQSVFSRIAAIAASSGAPLGALTGLYGKLALSQRDLNASGTQMMTLTTAVSNAIKVAGTSAESSSGAILGLSQALAAGKVDAGDFNQVLDGLTPLAQAAADGLLEAGGSVAKLRQLVKDGQVSSEAFFQALLIGSENLAGQADKSVATFAQSWEKVRTAITLAVGSIESLLSVGGRLTAWTDAVVADINKIPKAFETTAREIETVIGWFNKLTAAIPDFEDLRSASQRGLHAVDPDRFQRDAVDEPLAFRVLPKNRVSVKDKPVIGGGKGGGGGTGKTESELAREIAQIRERTGALNTEAQTVGKGEQAAAKAKAQYDLLEAAKRANVTVDGDMARTIDEVSTAYASAVANLDTAEKALRSSQQAMQEFKSIGESALGGFLSDLKEGESATQALENALSRLADRFIDLAAQMAFSGFGSGTGGGSGILDFFKNLFSGVGGAAGTGLVKAGPRAGGGPVMPGRMYTVGEKGPETFVPSTSGSILPHGSGGIRVENRIINQTNADVQTTAVKDGNGKLAIQTMIRGTVNDEVNRTGTQTNKSLQAGFGIRPQLTRR